MEAELLGDISHVLTDITPLVGAPTLVFRLSMLIGRIFAMESDYLPDKLIVKDELFFQLPLLGLSAVLAWRSLIPYLKAVSTKTSKLDDHVFEQLFKPVGVNPIQFRSMVATCIDWVVLDPGSQVVCENEDPLADETVHLYWLYEGDVTGAYEGNLWTHIERHNGKSIDDPSAVGLLSDMKFLYSLDMKQKKKIDSDVEIIKYPMATFRVGQKGATLMRIEADALYELMEHDEHLANSIRQLLLKSLQRKVGLLLRNNRKGFANALDLPFLKNLSRKTDAGSVPSSPNAGRKVKTKKLRLIRGLLTGESRRERKAKKEAEHAAAVAAGKTPPVTQSPLEGDEQDTIYGVDVENQSAIGPLPAVPSSVAT
ncbi:hypothetical protein MHU86_25029 [Fragilaria crotonensis]|nr:hypothetical protein MHU86_25029 [Fragilaria crotonensis]